MTTLKILPYTNNTQVECCCGSIISIHSIVYHIESIRHRELLELKNELLSLRNQLNS